MDQARPADNSFEENQAVLTETVAVLRRRMRWVHAGTATLALFGGVLAYLLAVVIVDQAQPGGVPLGIRRTLVTALLTLVFGGVVWFVIRPLVRRISNLYLAQQIERRHPEFRNSLVTALEYQGRSEVPGSMMAALIAKAAEDIRAGPLRGVVSLSRLKAATTVCGMAALCLVLYAWWTPIPMVPSIWRAFGAAIPVPKRTQIREISPPDGHIAVIGKPVRFETLLTGYQPDQVFIEFSSDGGNAWSAGGRIDLGPGSSTSARSHRGSRWFGASRPADLQRSVHWRLRAGDVTSEVRWLEIRPWPDVDGLSVTLRPPTYTGLPTVTQEGGRVEAIIGTRVNLRVSTNVPPKNPTAIFRWNGDETRIGLPADPKRERIVMGQFLVTGDGVYRIEFSDEFGNANRDPIPQQIRGLPDDRPTVELLQPTAPLALSPANVLSLSARIEDDFGLVRVQLHVQEGDIRRVVREVEVSAARTKTHDLRIDVPVRELTGSQGADLVYWVSAWDNRHDLAGRLASQEGVSSSMALRVRSPSRLSAGDDASSPQKKNGAVAGAMPDGSKEAKPGPRSSAATGDDRVAAADQSSTTSTGPVGVIPLNTSDKAATKTSDQGDLRQWVRANRDLIEQTEKLLSRGSESNPKSPREDASREQEQSEANSMTSADHSQNEAGKQTPDMTTPDERMPNSATVPEKSADRTGDQSSGQDSESQNAESGQPKSDGRQPEASPGSSGDSAKPDDTDSKDRGSADPMKRESGNDPKETSDQSTDTGEASEDAQSSENSEDRPDQPAQSPNAGNESTPDSGSADQKSASPGKPNEQTGSSKPCPSCTNESEGTQPSDSTSSPGSGPKAGESADPDQGGNQPGESSDQDESSDGAKPSNSPGGEQGGSPESGRPSPGGEAGTGNMNPADGAEKPVPPSKASPDSVSPSTDGDERPDPNQGPMLTGRLTDVGKVQPLVDELRRQLRAGEVDDALLADLEWTPERAAQFVRKFDRLIGGQRQTNETAIPRQRRPNVVRLDSDDEVLLGESMRSAVKAEGGESTLPPDSLRDIRRSERQKVSPPFRPLLDAYYQSISVAPATTQPAGNK